MIIKGKHRPVDIPLPGSLPPRVVKYKYLGAIVDSSLLLKEWCCSLRDAVNNRSLLIKRLAVTKKLSRRQVECLYTFIVRGKLSYALSIWSHSPHAKKVFQADSFNLRLCSGAILGTPLEEIARESRLPSLDTLINRADLRLYNAIRTRPELFLLSGLLDETLDVFNEELEHSIMYKIGYAPFLSGFLNDEFSNRDIRQRYPSPTSPPSRVRWRNEVYLSRIRMGCIPTRMWASRFGLTDDPLCRHCGAVEETQDHLFSDCENLDYSSLRALGINTSFTSIQSLLRSQGVSHEQQNLVLEFITSNNLYKTESFEEAPRKRRRPDISPKPSRSKRSKKSLVSKRTRSHSPGGSSPKRAKRGFSGPASFTHALQMGHHIVTDY